MGHFLSYLFFLLFSFSFFFNLFSYKKCFESYDIFIFIFIFILVYIAEYSTFLPFIHSSIFLSFLATSFLASFSKLPSLLPFIYRNAWITWIGKITGQKTVSQRNGNEKNSSTKGDISCSTNGVRTRNIWYSVLTLSHSPVSAIILYRICLSLSWSIDEP